jgi:hypothetical protein
MIKAEQDLLGTEGKRGSGVGGGGRIDPMYAHMNK